MNILEAKKYGKEQLKNSPSPDLDVSVLLQFVTGFDRTQLLLKRDCNLSKEQETNFLDAIKRRKTGLPVAYITRIPSFSKSALRTEIPTQPLPLHMSQISGIFFMLPSLFSFFE